MAFPELKLSRNLRKSILQGNPWIYRQALQNDGGLKQTSLVKVCDQKKQFVAWGYYSPSSPLAVRVLSLDKKPPGKLFFAKLLRQCLEKRSYIGSEDTNCYRLINGEGDFLPGIICDVYSSVAVLQFDGTGPYEFWDQNFLAEWLLENTECKTVYYKPRHDMEVEPLLWGEEPTTDYIEAKEHSSRFFVDIVNGQKTGFFLDQRENRNYIKSISKGKSVINLFSYSGGFSVYAGLGGASEVLSVDIAQGALDLAEKNWELNNLDTTKHKSQCADVFEYVVESKDLFDIVICDPPSLAKSERHKEQALQKYIDTFAAAAKKVKSGGHLVLSSCSSHISFEDFNIIMIEALSKARKRGQVMRVSGQGADHPYPHACPHLRYLKFLDIVIY